MSRIHQGKAVALHLTIEQYENLKQRAEAEELSPANYLRRLLGYPLERAGARKDLDEKGMLQKIGQQTKPVDGVRRPGRPRKEVSE